MVFILSVLSIIATAILTFTIWNLVTLRRIKNNSGSGNLNSDQYYELKYKYEFLIAVGAVITATIGIFGYNTIQSVEKALADDYSRKVDSVNIRIALSVSDFKSSINRSIDTTATEMQIIRQYLNSVDFKAKRTDAQISSYDIRMQELSSRQTSLSKKELQFDKKLDDVTKKIELINSKNILRQNYYITELIKVRRASVVMIRSSTSMNILWKNVPSSKLRLLFPVVR